jgi:L-cysteine:1D-myo-inositol 2-amino-2-deoxy-alpha-D-glucopyranoside ligase
MSQRPNEPGWESTFGMGRPGWHIECTAIALKYLNPSDLDETLIDIQGGGSDLIFPHHEMCAAQAHVLTGKELAYSYVHTGMIGLDGEKMSKSRGNLVFVSKLVAAGKDPMAIRWALMSDHYRSDRMWSDALMAIAEEQLDQLRKAINVVSTAPTDPVIAAIVDALSDDLDTPQVIAILMKWSADTLAGERGGFSADLRSALDGLLGLKL